MEVHPSSQSIDNLFSGTCFHIDFYQREYKWDRSTVQRLIEDIFYKFEQDYAKHSSLDPNPENVEKYYGWYYLNTYITNKDAGKVYVVDGQQRLTTLTLMLISVYRMSMSVYPDESLKDWVREKIAGVVRGGQREYRMSHEKRKPLMEALMAGDQATADMLEDSITARHMIENASHIDTELGKRLDSRHKFQTFVNYFLLKVVIINLEVTQADVPMVFEVINDRGVRLRPYEIMKGKLLGTIAKAEVDDYADVWEKAVSAIEVHDDAEVDNFFRFYLRAWYCSSRNESQRYDGDYHRVVFASGEGNPFKLEHNPEGVKAFLKGPFSYYSRLFLRLKRLSASPDSEVPECYYNSELLSMDGFIMLAMAACELEDPEETEKIRAVAQGHERTYVMLQLNRAYDSNQFQELLYRLTTSLHGRSAPDIESVINNVVLNDINSRQGTDNTSLLSYSQFKRVGYRDYNTRFRQYLLARVEKAVAYALDWGLQDDLKNYVRGTGKSNSYHVEHILSRNSESESLFTDADGEFDEELFEFERNRFGGLLLLKGRDNQSSGNETYSDKLRTYTGSAPYWARTLVPDFYKSNSAVDTLRSNTGLDFQPVPMFDRDALETRSKLMYEIICQIWAI